MALLPEDPRKQAMVMVVLVFLGGAALYWNFIWTPRQDEISILQLRVDSLEAQVADARREAAKGNARQFNDEATAFTAQLDAMRRVVPTANEVPTLLESVTTAARREGLDVSDVAPAGVLPGDQFDIYRYAIKVTGPYHDIAAFLEGIGSLERIIAPMNLQLAPSGRSLERKPGRNEQFIDADFQIQTYVARPNSALAPVAVPGPGGN